MRMYGPMRTMTSTCPAAKISLGTLLSHNYELFPCYFFSSFSSHTANTLHCLFPFGTTFCCLNLSFQPIILYFSPTIHLFWQHISFARRFPHPSAWFLSTNVVKVACFDPNHQLPTVLLVWELLFCVLPRCSPSYSSFKCLPESI